MSDGEVDIRLLALRRQQRRSQSRATVEHLLDADPAPYGRVRSGRSAYEATPVKAYVPEVRNGKMPAPLFDDEPHRLGRMHVPPVVRCECNGIETYALISSSDSVSTISIDLIRKMRLLDQVLPEPSQAHNPLSLHSAEPKGRVKYVDLALGAWKQVAQFNVVDNDASDVTLGIDFLRKTQSIVNFEDSALIIGGNKGEKVSFLNTRDIMMLSRKHANRSSFSPLIMD